VTEEGGGEEEFSRRKGGGKKVPVDYQIKGKERTGGLRIQNGSNIKG